VLRGNKEVSPKDSEVLLSAFEANRYAVASRNGDDIGFSMASAAFKTNGSDQEVVQQNDDKRLQKMQEMAKSLEESKERAVPS